jgi:hypothetical protein
MATDTANAQFSPKFNGNVYGKIITINAGYEPEPAFLMHLRCGYGF